MITLAVILDPTSDNIHIVQEILGILQDISRQVDAGHIPPSSAKPPSTTSMVRSVVVLRVLRMYDMIRGLFLSWRVQRQLLARHYRTIWYAFWWPPFCQALLTRSPFLALGNCAFL